MKCFNYFFPEFTRYFNLLVTHFNLYLAHIKMKGVICNYISNFSYYKQIVSRLRSTKQNGYTYQIPA